MHKGALSKTALLAAGLFLFACGAGPKPEANAPASEPSPAASIEKSADPSEAIKAGGADSPQAQQPASPAPSQPSVTVRLLSPGANPRRALRFHITQGKKESLVMDMTIKLTQDFGSGAPPRPITMPTTRMTIEMEPTQVSAGEIRYDFAYTGMEVLPVPGSSPAVAQRMQEMFRGMDQLKGWALIDDRGRTKAADMQMPPDLREELRSTFENARQTISQVSFPFPEESVGVGAQWETTTPVLTGVIRLEQTATYTLKSLQGDKGVLAIQFRQQAPQQKMNLKEAPEADLFLESYEGSGSGQNRFNLQSLTGESSMHMTSKVLVRASVKGHEQSATTSTEIDVRTRPGQAQGAGAKARAGK